MLLSIWAVLPSGLGGWDVPPFSQQCSSWRLRVGEGVGERTNLNGHLPYPWEWVMTAQEPKREGERWTHTEWDSGGNGWGRVREREGERWTHTEWVSGGNGWEWRSVRGHWLNKFCWLILEPAIKTSYCQGNALNHQFSLILLQTYKTGGKSSQLTGIW